MKYDKKSMPHMHDVILANVKAMCGNDKEIPKRFSPADGSPAPLRDYLKQTYKHRSQSNGNFRYACTPTNGIEIVIKNGFEDYGDDYLTLSWSQLTLFIKENWEEVFGKSELEETAVSKPTYKDVFLEHYPNFDMSRFEKFEKEACVEYYFEAPCPCDCDYECESHWNSECLYEWRNDIDDNDLERVKKYLKTDTDNTAEPVQKAQEIVPANAEKYVFACDGCKYDKQGCCNYPETQNDYCVNGDKKICSDPPAQNDTAATVFDYSELDSDTADKLRAVSERVISIKARYIIETAKQVKIAHDLLANNKSGLFGAWCESVGFTRQTGNNLVHVAETFPDLDIVKNFDNIKNPKALLYAASKPSAPPELVEAVKNGDITSHKDFVEMKKQLEEANKRAEDAEMLSRTYQQNYAQMNKNFQEACEDNTELEKRIKELESRPRDVVIQPDEKVLEENAELKSQLDEARNELMFANCKPSIDIKEFYETLHGAALSAIRDCEDFAHKHSECRARFKMLAESINDCINEMEE